MVPRTPIAAIIILVVDVVAASRTSNERQAQSQSLKEHFLPSSRMLRIEDRIDAVSPATKYASLEETSQLANEDRPRLFILMPASQGHTHLPGTASTEQLASETTTPAFRATPYLPAHQRADFVRITLGQAIKTVREGLVLWAVPIRSEDKTQRQLTETELVSRHLAQAWSVEGDTASARTLRLDLAATSQRSEQN